MNIKFAIGSSVALLMGAIIISTPAQAATHQSCSGNNLVTIRTVYRFIPGRTTPLKTQEITVNHNHPLCRAER